MQIFFRKKCKICRKFEKIKKFFEIRLEKNRKKILKVVKITENHGKMVEILQRIFPRFGFGNFQIFFQKVENFSEIHKKCRFFLEKNAKSAENLKKLRNFLKKL